MKSLLDKVTRVLAKQRTVAFYTDQEQKIEELSETYDVKIGITELARAGLDLALAQLEEELTSKQKKLKK